MRPIQDSYSIVVLGAWNPSIFTPEWVVSNLADGETCDVQMAFPIDDPTAPRRITFEGINFFPGRRQINLSPTTPDLGGMKKCSAILVKILALLVHTPVSSAGVNFSFSEDNPTEQMLSALLPSDSDSILGEYPIKETKIHRVLKRGDDVHVLNFTIAQNDTGCALSFNFHYDIATVNGYQELFSNNNVEEHFNAAIDFTNKCYEIDLETDEPEE